MGAKGKKVKITTQLISLTMQGINVYHFIICFVVNNFKPCQPINHLYAHKFITFSTNE